MINTDYRYNGNIYRVVAEVHMKSCCVHSWDLGVLYIRNLEMFVRTKDDFLSKFEKAEIDERETGNTTEVPICFKE